MLSDQDRRNLHLAVTCGLLTPEQAQECRRRLEDADTSLLSLLKNLRFLDSRELCLLESLVAKQEDSGGTVEAAILPEFAPLGFSPLAEPQQGTTRAPGAPLPVSGTDAVAEGRPRAAIAPGAQEAAEDESDRATVLRQQGKAPGERQAAGKTPQTRLREPAFSGVEEAGARDPLIGRRLGRYKIESRLGRGGMGAVYEAFDADLQRTVALKVLLVGDFSLEQMLKRFQREAQAVARMGRHPNIVQVHDSGSEPGLYYFTMDLVAGGTLAEWSGRETRTVRQLVEVICGVAEALAHAHEHGIIHRDLKPQNILMDEKESPLVTDFGLAREVETDSSISLSGQVMGTPAYMAPEQAKGLIRELGPASDVYSLGVVLYEALAGVNPFRREGMGETLLATIRDDPVALRKVNPKVPRDIETIVMKCLHKEPPDRYPDGAALSADLKRWLEGEAVQATRPSTFYRARRWVGKRRALSTLAAILFVAVAAAVVALMVLGRRGREVERLRRQARNIRETVLYKEAQKVLAVGLAHRRYGNTEELEGGVIEVGRKADEALRLNPDSVEAYFVKGWALRLSGKWKEAIKQYDEVLKRTPGDPAARFERGWGHVVLYGRAREEAIRAWKQQRREPVSGFAFSRPQAVKSEQPGEADLVQLRPEIQSYRARAKEDFAHLEEEALRGAGFFESASGLAALAEGECEQARGWFEKALGLDETRDEALEGLARALYELWRRGSVDSAELLARLEGCLERHKGLDRLYLVRANVRDEEAGRLFGKKGREQEAYSLWEEAEQDATRAVNLWPHGGEEYAARSWIRSSWAEALGCRGDPRAGSLLAAAVADGGQAIEKEPGSKEGYDSRGGAWARLGEWKASCGEDPSEEYASAIDDFTAALRRSPQDAGAYSNRGCAWCAWGYWKTGRGEDPSAAYARAIEDYGAAVRLNPHHARAYHNRGIVQLRLGEWKASRGENPREEYERAIEDCAEAAKKDPAYAEADNARGNARWKLGEWKASRGDDPRQDYERAIGDYTRALEKNPKHVCAHSNRGNVRWSWGRWKAARGQDPTSSYEEALADFTAALGINRDYVGGYNGRANVRWSLGEWMAAQGKDPAGHYEKAIEDYTTALGINPRHVLTLSNRGNAWWRWGEWKAGRAEDPTQQYAKAVEDYTTALGVNPQHVQAYANRAGVFWGWGDWKASRGENPRSEYEGAIADCSSALACNPEHAGSYNNRGLARWSLAAWKESRGEDPTQQYQGAIEDFTASLQRNRQYVDALYNRGNVRLELGRWMGRQGEDPTRRYRNAIADFTSALEKNPHDADTYLMRAATWQELENWKETRGEEPTQDFERALADYGELLKRRPASCLAWANRGLIYESLGRFEEALAQYEQGYRSSKDERLKVLIDELRQRINEQ